MRSFNGFQTMWVHASRVSLRNPKSGEYENIYAGLIDVGKSTTEDGEAQKREARKKEALKNEVLEDVELKFSACGGRQKRMWFEMEEEERKEIQVEWDRIQKKRLQAAQSAQSMGGSSK